MFSCFKIKKNTKVITRIPPSPTGNLHVGTARTALFNYLYAKKYNGKVLLRLEDTDTERSTREFEKNILEGLEWLGIKWDNKKIIHQSKRKHIYKKYLEKLIKEKKAYVSKEEAGNRDEVIRFKNPNEKITFEDKIRGTITFDTSELKDFIIAKSLNEPLYHLAVVIDDFEMKISHVIRGEDHISNTQRQILLQEAIGAPRPIYAHLPLLLGKDKSKLSKRHGSTSISEYKEQGYLPEAMINYLAFLGWNPGTDQEIFDMKELIDNFSLEKVQKGGAIFNVEKLDWFNKEYIKKLPKRVVKEKILKKLDEKKTEKVIPIILDRISKINQIEEILEEELNFLFEKPEDFNIEKLLWKDEKDLNKVKEHLEFIKTKLETISDNEFNQDIIKEKIWNYASEKGRGNVLWPFRYSLSGKEKSPDPFEIAEILGKEETISRISSSISKIEQR
jgi:glutamyl-tRNA synthetase